MKMLRMALSVAFVLIGLCALGMMFSAETHTVPGQFNYYSQWAMAGGLIFLMVGAALTAFEYDDESKLEFEKEDGK